MGLLDLIFPKACLECGKEGKYICDRCLGKVQLRGWYGKTYSIFKYEGVIRKAILTLKYKYSTEIAKELAQICAQKLHSLNLPKSTILVPIPLHWYKKNLRGFNQSEEIGKIVAKEMEWKFIPDLLLKKKATPSQVELSGHARRKNVSGVFTVNSKYDLSALGSILIFDDVYTTGSTLKEAMKSLETEKVWGLTITR